MRTVIIGGGSLDIETAIRVINGEKVFLIAADRGLDYCRLLHIRPQLAVGDFDSVSEGTKLMIPDFEREGMTIIRLNPEKDDSDLEAALDIAVDKVPDGNIDILGATGSRIDHLIGNIGLLKRAHDKGRCAMITDRTNRLRLLPEGGRVSIRRDSQYGRYVSLLPVFGPCRGVSATGVYYPLDNADIGDGTYYCTYTISNEITEETAVFSVTKGNLLITESKD